MANLIHSEKIAWRVKHNPTTIGERLISVSTYYILMAPSRTVAREKAYPFLHGNPEEYEIEQLSKEGDTVIFLFGD